MVCFIRNCRWTGTAVLATAAVLRMLACLAFLTLTVCGAAAQTGKVKRIALVVGNGAYTNMLPLRNTTNDARDMAAAFRELHFVVIEAIDLPKPALEKQIRAFSDALADAEGRRGRLDRHAAPARSRLHRKPSLSL
jgi:hypothetical protein